MRSHRMPEESWHGVRWRICRSQITMRKDWYDSQNFGLCCFTEKKDKHILWECGNEPRQILLLSDSDNHLRQLQRLLQLAGSSRPIRTDS